MSQHLPAASAPPSPHRQSGPRRWLLFVHQLPSNPSNLRVRTWRRLQHIGAIPLKQAVYVLPDTPNAREDFEWLRVDVNRVGGEASVFSSETLEPWEDDALIEEFRRLRQAAYGALAGDLERALKDTGATRPARGGTTAGPRQLKGFRERLTAIEGVDFFGSSGRDRATTLLSQLADRTSGGKGQGSPSGSVTSSLQSYQGRIWITRPRPGVDRMASGWLIRRFIDPGARFGFAADREAVPEGGVPFDMFGVDFSHTGDGCTFETLCATFGIREPAVARIAAIVHDLDLKDERFGAPEAATLGAIIEGLRLAWPDDDDLLAQGMALFDSLYRSFEQTARSTGPRAVARPRKQVAPPRKTARRKKS